MQSIGQKRGGEMKMQTACDLKLNSFSEIYSTENVKIAFSTLYHGEVIYGRFFYVLNHHSEVVIRNVSSSQTILIRVFILQLMLLNVCKIFSVFFNDVDD